MTLNLTIASIWHWALLFKGYETIRPPQVVLPIGLLWYPGLCTGMCILSKSDTRSHVQDACNDTCVWNLQNVLDGPRCSPTEDKEWKARNVEHQNGCLLSYATEDHTAVYFNAFMAEEIIYSFGPRRPSLQMNSHVSARRRWINFSHTLWCQIRRLSVWLGLSNVRFAKIF